MPLIYNYTFENNIEILFIDDRIALNPEDIKRLSDNHLIMILRRWENEGEHIYQEEHAKYQRPDKYEWPRPGLVYFALRSDGLIKIGFTTRPKARYQRLTEQQGERLEILHEIKSENPFELEQQIHQELNEYRIKGEWFDLPATVIEEYKSNGKAKDMDQG